jgi:hypothetical protein
LRLAAKGRITDEELDEELAALEETRQTAERELEVLRWHKERVEQMERDRDAVLDYYAAVAPERLELPDLRGTPPSLQDAQAEGLGGQERESGDRDGRRAGGRGQLRGGFFHNGGHVEVCPHGRPIVKRVKLADPLREFGRA